MWNIFQFLVAIPNLTYPLRFFCWFFSHYNWTKIIQISVRQIYHVSVIWSVIKRSYNKCHDLIDNDNVVLVTIITYKIMKQSLNIIMNMNNRWIFYGIEELISYNCKYRWEKDWATIITNKKYKSNKNSGIKSTYWCNPKSSRYRRRWSQTEG